MNKKISFENEIVLKTELFEIGQDWDVPIPGFFIIAPNRKMKSFAEFSKEESLEFIQLLVKLRKGMKDVLGIEDVYFFQNEDTEHGFHFWVFPRLNWMQKFGIKIQSVRPIMNYAKENMFTENIISELKNYVSKMKIYMEK